MKCHCVAILVITFVIQLTNAAPPFDIDSFFDELLAMNVRMGDFILKTKSEYKELKAKELTDNTAGVSDNNNQGDDPIIELNGYETSVRGNESHDSVKETGNDVERPVYDKVKKAERSFIGPALDGIGNHWDDWFDKKKIEDDDSQDGSVNDTEKDDKVKKTVEDVVLPVENDNNNDKIAPSQPSDQPIDQLDVSVVGFSDQKCLGTVDKPTDNEEPDNSELNKSEPNNSEPTTPGPDDTEADNKTEASQQGTISDSDDVGHDQDLGEETFNNKSEVEKGWLDNAIDGLVSFFG